MRRSAVRLKARVRGFVWPSRAVLRASRAHVHKFAHVSCLFLFQDCFSVKLLLPVVADWHRASGALPEIAALYAMFPKCSIFSRLVAGAVEVGSGIRQWNFYVLPFLRKTVGRVTRCRLRDPYPPEPQ